MPKNMLIQKVKQTISKYFKIRRSLATPSVCCLETKHDSKNARSVTGLEDMEDRVCTTEDDEAAVM